MDKKTFIIGAVVGLAVGVYIAGLVVEYTRPKSFWQKVIGAFR